jgi:hypothetical protein
LQYQLDPPVMFMVFGVLVAIAIPICLGVFAMFLAYKWR